MLRSLEGGHISIQTIMLNTNNQHTLIYVVNVSFKFGSVSIYHLIIRYSMYLHVKYFTISPESSLF